MARPRLLHLRFEPRSVTAILPSRSGPVVSRPTSAGEFPLRRLRPWSPSPRIDGSATVASLGAFANEPGLPGSLLRFLEDQAPKVELIGRWGVLLDLSGCERLHPNRGTLLGEINQRLPRNGSLGMAAGEGTTRVVARLAAAVAPPGSWWCVEPAKSTSFLAPFPLQCLKDEYPRWVDALIDLGLQTLGDLAVIPSDLLQRALGAGARAIWEDARGEGSHAVHRRLEPPLLRARHRFPRPESEPGLVASALGVLADRLAVELRAHQLVTSRLQLRIGFHGGGRLQRSKTLTSASDNLHEIRTAGWALWKEGAQRRTAATFCELRAELLRPRPAEALCFDFAKAREDLAPAINSIRQRFGSTAIQWSPELWMD